MKNHTRKKPDVVPVAVVTQGSTKPTRDKHSKIKGKKITDSGKK